MSVLQVPKAGSRKTGRLPQKSTLGSPLASTAGKCWLGSLQSLGSFAAPSSHSQFGAEALSQKKKGSRNCIEITLMSALASH